MTGFSMKCNTVLKWFKRISIINKSVKNGFQMVVNTETFFLSDHFHGHWFYLINPNVLLLPIPKWLTSDNFTFNPSHPNHGRREKIKLNFYFHTSLWCLETLWRPYKIFWGTTKKCENKNLTKYLSEYNFQKCMGR